MTASESRDGTGGADHDQPFEFDKHMAGLTWQQQARCVRMRGFVRDVSHAPAGIRGELKYGDDLDWVRVAPSGLYIPHQTPNFGRWWPQAEAS